MSLEKAEINWTFQQLSRMILDGKIDLSHIVQRGVAWERSRQSALIESAILGYPIPPVFAKKSEDSDGNRIYSIMDGKQRLTAIKRYLSNEFQLTALPPLSYMDHEDGKVKTLDVTGKKFDDLPEALKSLLKTLTVNVIYFDNLTKEEERELFKRLNAGKPLSNKSKILANCKDIEDVMDIGSHPLFEEMLSDVAKGNKGQVAIIIKAWNMLNKKIDEISFESKVFNPQIENTTISDDEKDELLSIFDTIVLIHQTMMGNKWKLAAKKIYTETHLVSIIPFVRMCMEANHSNDEMAIWLNSFFGVKKVASVSSAYNNACLGGSAKPYNIKIRHNELLSHYNNHFSPVNNQAEDSEELTGEYKNIVDDILNDLV